MIYDPTTKNLVVNIKEEISNIFKCMEERYGVENAAKFNLDDIYESKCFSNLAESLNDCLYRELKKYFEGEKNE